MLATAAWAETDFPSVLGKHLVAQGCRGAQGWGAPPVAPPYRTDLKGEALAGVSGPSAGCLWLLSGFSGNSPALLGEQDTPG